MHTWVIIKNVSGNLSCPLNWWVMGKASCWNILTFQINPDLCFHISAWNRMEQQNWNRVWMDVWKMPRLYSSHITPYYINKELSNYIISWKNSFIFLFCFLLSLGKIEKIRQVPPASPCSSDGALPSPLSDLGSDDSGGGQRPKNFMQTLMEDYETHKVKRQEKTDDNSVSLLWSGS